MRLDGKWKMEDGKCGLSIFHSPFAIFHHLWLAGIMMLGGCAIHQPPNAPTTQPSLATTQPSYWLSMPATSAVSASDFNQLWKDCQKTAHHYGFTIDRLDLRAGVITTQPLVSKQFFEFWRPDVVTMDDLMRSSLATYRRTLRFQISKAEGGGYRAEPSILIERYVRAEKTITASIYLRKAFQNDKGKPSVGTPEADQGVFLPRQYWYPTGRDTALEKRVADNLAKRLQKKSA
jgi:hypothetical protein